MRSATPLVAVLALVAACGREPPPGDAGCSRRTDQLRETLRSAYSGNTPPVGVAGWVGPLYREFAATRDVTRRAALLDEGVARTIDGCYGLADAFRGAADAPAGARRAAMARLVPDALASCRCRGVDVESLAFLLRLSPAP